MAASDYMGGVRAPFPADWAAPLIGAQLGQQLANLPNQYYKTAEEKRQYDLARAFQGGLPTNRATGGIDYAAVLQRLAQGGDYSQIPALSNLDLQRQALAAATAGDQGPLGASPAPQAASPSAPPSAQPQAQPGGSKTVGQYLREAGFSNQDIVKFASSVGISPGAIMAGSVQSRVTDALDKYMRGGAPIAGTSGSGASEMNQPARTASAADASANVRSPNDTAEPQNNAVMGGDGAPQVPMSGASGSAAPVGGPAEAQQTASTAPFMAAPKQQAEPAAGGGPRMAQAAPTPAAPPAPPSGAPQLTAITDPSLGGLVPRPFVQRYGKDAAGEFIRYANKQAQLYGIAGQKAASDTWKQTAQDVAVALQKASEPTTGMKEAAAEGQTVSQQKATQAQQGEEIKQYAKLDTGIQALANTSVGMLPTLQAADSLLNAGASTGYGADWALKARQIWTRIGGDPNAAMTLEAFGKQMAAFINQQTNTLKSESIEMGGSSMRIFSAQIENMQKASPSPDYTPAGNRYLIEVYRRAIDRANFIANQANQYKTQKAQAGQPGGLDSRFETWMRKWQTDNPMFDKREMEDPRRVAPPTIQSPADIAKFGIKPGDPVRRSPNGPVEYYTGPKKAPGPQDTL